MVNMKVTTQVITHKTKPCKKGLMPTEFITFFDKPAPIRNNASVKPFLEAITTKGAMVGSPGT
jgi:hypothetical protein